MYVESFESFAAQAEALWRAAPLRTRYVMKYRHCDGRLVLKVTDDATVRGGGECRRRRGGVGRPTWRHCPGRPPGRPRLI
jgi:hypothetical protein